MKGKVALLVLGVGLLATGCGSGQADGPENISFGDGESSIVVDSKTGVEYIKTEIITEKGWYYTYCPRFDKDGQLSMTTPSPATRADGQADGPENISFGDGESSIVVDSKTGVEYIKTEIITEKGWYYTYCPRFDKDGRLSMTTPSPATRADGH